MPTYENKNYWQIDVWTAGVTLMEVAIGFPVWATKKCVVQHQNKRRFLAQSGLLNCEHK